jgi:hypothetical protein
MRHRPVSYLTVILFATLSAAGPLLAHHAFAPMFDGEKIIRLKGVVSRFEWVNPHTFIIVDVQGADGKTEQWALEGPAPNGLTRRGFSPASIKPGETVEACGYGARADFTRTVAVAGDSRRILNVELLTRSEGGPQVWQDYGQRKCREALEAKPQD